MDEKTNDRGIAHDGSHGEAAPAPTPAASSPAAASPTATPSASPAHVSLLGRLAGFVHKVGDFIERHPIAALELGRLLAEIHSMGLKPDEVEQLKNMVGNVIDPAAPAPTGEA